MICEKPRTTALSLGATIAILYSFCALTFAIFPSMAIGLINSVNHGLNLKALEVGQASFTFGGFLVGLICLTVYAMIAGFIYGAIRNRLQRSESEPLEIVRKTSSARA